MKKTKMSFFVAFAMVIATLLSAFVAFGATDKKAKALSEGYNGESNTIYCFTDFYCTYSYDALQEEYSSTYNIVVDRQKNLTSSDFDLMVSNNYFNGFGTNCVVIIDIKTFVPEPATLNNLFMELQSGQGCTTIYVSSYDYDNGSEPTEFMTYVDYFQYSNFGSLRDFFGDVFDDLRSRQSNNMLKNTMILLDSDLVPIDSTLLLSADFLPSLCTTSIFLRILFEELLDYFGLTGVSQNELITNVQNAVTANNIRIMVRLDASNFIDIFGRYTFTNATASSLFGELGPNGEILSAVGFSHLETEFYNFLLSGQNVMTLPVYLLEVEPIVYTGSGLAIISDTELNEEDETRPEEVIEAMDGLANVLF